MTGRVGVETPPRTDRSAWRLRRRTRLWVLTTHIVLSVGLLGDAAGFLAVAIRHVTSNDSAFVASTLDLLGMFALYFGIPLSFLALLTGLLLGLGTRWGVLRYPWVVTKLILITTVILVGAIVLRPLLFGNDVNDTALIVGAGYDVAALATATGLAVFKPGRRFGSATTEREATRRREGDVD
ncbi:MAG: hypothetical protein WBV06_13205 [Acidimicrobiia bacterium]